MKTRIGFVSNSSSASFIVHWRVRTMGEEVSLKEALSDLFEAYVYDQDTKDWNWDRQFRVDEYKAMFEEIDGRTVQNADQSFTTSFWTSMMNSPEDFGHAAMSLVMALTIRKGMAEIIDTKVGDDN